HSVLSHRDAEGGTIGAMKGFIEIKPTRRRNFFGVRSRPAHRSLGEGGSYRFSSGMRSLPVKTAKLISPGTS
ncbi:MAG: hypothetical protein WC637_08165, partial [Victivallales bacterium]